jgi:hypothetical protein
MYCSVTTSLGRLRTPPPLAAHHIVFLAIKNSPVRALTYGQILDFAQFNFPAINGKVSEMLLPLGFAFLSLAIRLGKKLARVFDSGRPQTANNADIILELNRIGIEITNCGLWFRRKSA